MEDADYKIALLLQRQLEHEAEYDSDLHLARQLQEDLNKQVSTESSTGLTYDNKRKTEGDDRSLIDPSWELIDPTPNIHNLFVVLNQRFFWNKLVTVCVSWAKAMTSCAGVCSYQGRGGMCSIRLSEPLLKLRPRKDLMETLLHEMIHAYLFVTDNNKDRDGHGPEFHKHMYRINKEAGTNITVYHDFHDEVRLYQQHWWRCNGPCQTRHPYFGMVRRAINRAPGPHDRWWGEHSRTCGGTFVKVKEPDKKSKQKGTSKSTSKTAPGSDIRKFITSTNKSISNATINVFNNNPNEICSKVPRIFTIDDLQGLRNLDTSSGPIITEVSGEDLERKNSSNTQTKFISNSTIVIDDSNTTGGNTTHTKTDTEASGSGKSQVLAGPSSICKQDDYSVVRNHWINKFPSTSQPNKRSSNDSVENIKKTKIDNADNTNNFVVVCPVCDKQVSESMLNEHLDQCLVEHENKEAKCTDTSIEENRAQCEICNSMVNKNDLETHRKQCLEEIWSNSTPIEVPSDQPASVKITGDLVQCSVCDDFVDSESLNVHQQQCLLNIFNELEKEHGYDNKVSCLVCSRRIRKSQLNTHLDDCMSGVFEDKKEEKVKIHDCNDESGTSKYNCPFCMELYSEMDMSGHLDECLISDDDNKSIVVDSFTCDD